MKALTVVFVIGLMMMTYAFGRQSIQAAERTTTRPAKADVVCVEWAVVPPRKITRCEDEWTGEVCFDSTSGMLQCRFD